MGQREVIAWLINRREIGDDKFYLPKEIARGLRDSGATNGALEHIRGDCFSLWQHGNGCLEMYDYDKKGVTNWLKAFRIKKEYCKNGRK